VKREHRPNTPQVYESKKNLVNRQSAPSRTHGGPHF
jgi:hypothetical protein